jgi:hypothetical protein
MRYPCAALIAVIIALSAAPAFAGHDRDGFEARDRYSHSYKAGPDRDGFRDNYGYEAWRDRDWRWDRDDNREPVANVPEIDAASGLAALAAVCGALAFTWERRRRAG